MSINTSLGQHWLHDREALREMCESANVSSDDTVLEIGPGLGTLTQQLAKRSKNVIAIEFDQELAEKLLSRITVTNVNVIHQDFLQYNLFDLPTGYKVVANLPYYITSKIVRRLLTAINPPTIITILVQKEVAERMAASPGNLSILGVATQYYAETKLGSVVPAALFTPPPKVDSQIITLTRRKKLLYAGVPTELYFKVVKAGFSAKRKMLRSSLSGGLALSKIEVEDLLRGASIDPSMRAEVLSLDQWAELTKAYAKHDSKR